MVLTPFRVDNNFAPHFKIQSAAVARDSIVDDSSGGRNWLSQRCGYEHISHAAVTSRDVSVCTEQRTEHYPGLVQM